MRQVTRKGLMTMAAATGVLAAAGGAAHADSGAHGSASGSPGVLSGNTVQAPVHVPVNVCGNTVDVIGILNPSAGNACVNQGGGASGGYGDSDGHGDSGGQGGAHAGGHATDSPGVGSGNHVQVPVEVPVNVCGNSVDVVGLGNATAGDDCVNEDGPHGNPPGGPETPPVKPENPGNPGEPEKPATPDTPATPEKPDAPDQPRGNDPEVQLVSQPKGTAQLAQTGSDLPLGLVLPVGAGALLAGAVLYRKARASA
ncbi:DUF320 domain-containing protein [Streptomyces sp. PRKS01-65]|nr:chaplin family protein [Streptomyces harenosi]NEY31778.1 DUF320 domain-containing protein [Streptomyces harenosi]